MSGSGWLHETPAGPLVTLPGVTGTAGPYQAASATLAHGSVQAPVQLWSMKPRSA